MTIKIDKDNLEKALSNVGKDNEEKDKKKKKCCKENGEDCECKSESEISGQEEIGFHKGALNTLAAERNELVKMIQNVEAIMQAHLKRLEELGIKIPVEKGK